MTTRKNYNSIVFLTTLSVYLGLVLVGAPAPILAQVNSVTSQNKNVNSEDEFNNKPIDEFTDKVRQLINNGKLNLSKPFEIQFVADVVGKNFTNPKFQLIAGDSLIDELQRQWFEAISKSNFPIDDSLVDAIGFTAKNDGETLTTKVSLKVKKAENVSVFCSILNIGIFFASKEEGINFQKKIIAKNTVVIPEKNQVFIVTRLPRGSLDALLNQTSAK
jgi:ribosomal protein L9